MNTFDVDECAAFLKVHSNTVLELAAKGELPGAKIGRAWIFVEDDVVDYLRAKVREQTMARKLTIEQSAEIDRVAGRHSPSLLAAPATAFGARVRSKRNPKPILPDWPPSG